MGAFLAVFIIFDLQSFGPVSSELGFVLLTVSTFISCFLYSVSAFFDRFYYFRSHFEFESPFLTVSIISDLILGL